MERKAFNGFRDRPDRPLRHLSLLPLLAGSYTIKATYAGGKAIVEKYALKVDPELHKEVKDRYNALGLKPYDGFINPEIVPVTKNGQVVDYKVEYPSDFVAQHLKYGKEYSFLKAVH